MFVAADIARHQWHTSQHIFCSANIQAGQVSAAGRVEEHWHSIALHDRVGRQFDGLKVIELAAYTMVCSMVYSLIYTMVHTMVYSIIYNMIYISN
jgi:hypothetical protein